MKISRSAEHSWRGRHCILRSGIGEVAEPKAKLEYKTLNYIQMENRSINGNFANTMLGVVLCPDCFGDGKETCHNPDHGFLSMIGSVVGANESACPCCGHSEDHKIRKYVGWVDGKMKWEQPKCYTCDGTGQVTKEDYDKFLDENVPEDDRDYVDEKCLKNYA